MTYTITCGSESVTLPSPDKIVKSYSAAVNVINKAGSLPILSSIGLESLRVELSGWIKAEGQNIEQLYSNYVSKIESWVYKEVSVTGLGSAWNGNYILSRFEHDPEIGADIYNYSIELLKGSSHVVL